jgi:hypothetical protein
MKNCAGAIALLISPKPTISFRAQNYSSTRIESNLSNDITMPPKQELLQELETAPSPLITDLLNF